METPIPSRNLRVIRPDFLWAKQKLDDVLFGCILNIKLFQSGICSKLLINMDEQDMLDYSKLLDCIFAR